MALRSDVVLALPTGAGKTLTAVLLTLVENGYTVVILPLIALMEDWERRLKELKIPYERFMGAENPTLEGEHNLILVSADMARGASWRTAIAELNQRRPVHRYVLDEAHYYVMDKVFCKDAFDNAFQLRQFPAQFVLMAATITAAMQRYLEAQLELTNVRRISTTIYRPELSIPGRHHQHQLCDTSGAPQGGDRGGDSVGGVQVVQRQPLFGVYGAKLVEDLGLELYHAHSAENPIEDEERRAVYARWTKGKKVGMVCTTALAAGNDYAHVQFTAHFNPPYDVTTLIQQAGRAGRDGKPARNWILASRLQRPSHAVLPKADDLCGKRAMLTLTHPPLSYQYPHICLNFQITEYFDGQGQGKTCADLACPTPCEPCTAGIFHFFF
ncbi:P-loop containing nucleoside triphosphate hydrolase protein [Mycena olivaceomarginata]|nr:P-loop containing nucleoside triphosphate hydrolase protein [Mycena olivaceomarginata]